MRERISMKKACAPHKKCPLVSFSCASERVRIVAVGIRIFAIKESVYLPVNGQTRQKQNISSLTCLNVKSEHFGQYTQWCLVYSHPHCLLQMEIQLCGLWIILNTASSMSCISLSQRASQPLFAIYLPDKNPISNRNKQKILSLVFLFNAIKHPFFIVSRLRFYTQVRTLPKRSAP